MIHPLHHWKLQCSRELMMLLLLLWVGDIIPSKAATPRVNGSATISACHATDGKVDYIQSRFVKAFLRNNCLYTSKVLSNSYTYFLWTPSDMPLFWESFLYTKWLNTTTCNESCKVPLSDNIQIIFTWVTDTVSIEITVIITARP